MLERFIFVINVLTSTSAGKAWLLSLSVTYKTKRAINMNA